MNDNEEEVSEVHCMPKTKAQVRAAIANNDEY